MKNFKIFKKIDLRAIQVSVMLIILMGFLYLFYYFFTSYREYTGVKIKKPHRTIEPEQIETPVYYTFVPEKERIYDYQLFWFREKKAPAEMKKGNTMSGKSQAQQKSSQYKILGVVKRDKLFLVLRFLKDNKIRLVAQGEAIDDQTTVKNLSYKEAILSDPSGGEQRHTIFKIEPITILKDKPGEMKKKK